MCSYHLYFILIKIQFYKLFLSLSVFNFSCLFSTLTTLVCVCIFQYYFCYYYDKPINRTGQAVVEQNVVVAFVQVYHYLAEESGQARATQHTGPDVSCGQLVPFLVFDRDVHVAVIRQFGAPE